MASYRLKLLQNNAILDRIVTNSNDWLQLSSGFVIELRVHHHLQQHSFQKFFYMKDIEFLSVSGAHRFLMNIFFPEQILPQHQGEFVDRNGIQLSLPNPTGVSGSLLTRTVYSLGYVALFVRHSCWLMRNDPRNRSMKFLPVQMDLEVLRNQNSRRLDDSIIWDAVDDDEAIYNPVGLSQVQALKEVKVEGSSSVDCSICLESVGVGRIASQTPCNHIFHTNCILSWLQKKLSCPLCRAPVRC